MMVEYRKETAMFKFVKTIYSKTWHSHYDLFVDENGYYLAANGNTNFSVLGLRNFVEQGTQFVYRLAEPKFEGKSVEDVVNVIEYNNVLSFVYKKNNRFALVPAIPGNEDEIKMMYHQMHTYGNYDFIMIECPNCKIQYLFKDSSLPNGFKYESKCANCGFVNIRIKK